MISYPSVYFVWSQDPNASEQDREITCLSSVDQEAFRNEELEESHSTSLITDLTVDENNAPVTPFEYKNVIAWEVILVIFYSRFNLM